MPQINAVLTGFEYSPLPEDTNLTAIYKGLYDPDYDLSKCEMSDNVQFSIEADVNSYSSPSPSRNLEYEDSSLFTPGLHTWDAYVAPGAQVDALG